MAGVGLMLAGVKQLLLMAWLLVPALGFAADPTESDDSRPMPAPQYGGDWSPAASLGIHSERLVQDPENRSSPYRLNLSPRSIEVLHEMLPIEQPGLLPHGAAIRSVSVRDSDVVVTVARPEASDLLVYLLPRSGSPVEGEPFRVQIEVASLEPEAQAIRRAIVQLVRDKEGAFRWEEAAGTGTVFEGRGADSSDSSKTGRACSDHRERTSLPWAGAGAGAVAGTEPEPAPDSRTRTRPDPDPGAATIAIAATLIALMAWAVLWKRRADRRGEGS